MATLETERLRLTIAQTLLNAHRLRWTLRCQALLRTTLEDRVINWEIAQLRHYTQGGRPADQRDLTLAWQATVRECPNRGYRPFSSLQRSDL